MQKKSERSIHSLILKDQYSPNKWNKWIFGTKTYSKIGVKHRRKILGVQWRMAGTILEENLSRIFPITIPPNVDDISCQSLLENLLRPNSEITTFLLQYVRNLRNLHWFRDWLCQMCLSAEISEKTFEMKAIVCFFLDWSVCKRSGVIWHKK